MQGCTFSWNIIPLSKIINFHQKLEKNKNRFFRWIWGKMVFRWKLSIKMGDTTFNVQFKFFFVSFTLKPSFDPITWAYLLSNYLKPSFPSVSLLFFQSFFTFLSPTTSLTFSISLKTFPSLCLHEISKLFLLSETFPTYL